MKKRTKKDHMNIFHAYMKKSNEYRKMTLAELKLIEPTLKKGLTYHDAITEMIKEKEVEEIIKSRNKQKNEGIQAQTDELPSSTTT